MNYAAIGAKFNMLTIMALDHIKPYGTRMWLCKCDCGKTKVVADNALRGNLTKSCGCYRKTGVSGTKHGMSKTRVYHIWQGMVQRCTDPNHISAEYYSEQGVKVCERWRKFENFFADMGEPPTEHHSIDRIKSEGNYEPRNCRWATSTEQANNTKSNTVVTIDGVSKTASAWAREYGVSNHRVLWRLRHGWDPLDALTKPPRATYPRPLKSDDTPLLCPGTA